MLGLYNRWDASSMKYQGRSFENANAIDRIQLNNVILAMILAERLIPTHNEEGKCVER